MAAEKVKKISVKCRVNGKAYSLKVYPMARLLDVLREDLGLTGTKEGCGEGECGACSVIVDGKLVNSCLVPMLQVEGAKVRTIESMGNPDKLNKVQESFLKTGGAQCGICTPGMIMASMHLLEKKSKPTAQEIRVGLAGNLCRCTGYMKIFEAVAGGKLT